MSRYAAGRRFEWKVRDQLRKQGFFVLRSAGSKSPVDLVATKHTEPPEATSFRFAGRGITNILFVQCKRDGKLPLKEKQILYKLSHENGATPILAFDEGRLGVGMREVEAC